MDWAKKTANSILYLQNFLLSFLDHFLQYKLNIIYFEYIYIEILNKYRLKGMK